MRIPISSNEHSHHNVILQSTYVYLYNYICIKWKFQNFHEIVPPLARESLRWLAAITTVPRVYRRASWECLQLS